MQEIDVNLPEWLAKELPVPIAPHTLDFTEDGNGFMLELTTGRLIELKGDTLAEAHDEARAMDLGDFIFSKKILKKHKKKALSSTMISVPSGTKGFTRMLGMSTDDARLNSLKSAYAAFLKHDENWRNSPNFYNSYFWLDAHPAFWTRMDWKTFNPWAWNTDDFMGFHNGVRLYVYKSKKGKVSFQFEMGEHVSESQEWDEDNNCYILTGAYKNHYFDPRLTVTAKTFEKAVIKAAKRLDKFYNTDGTAKENVDYEPSGEEIMIDDAVAQVSDGSGSDWWDNLPRRRYVDEKSSDNENS